MSKDAQKIIDAFGKAIAAAGTCISPSSVKQAAEHIAKCGNPDEVEIAAAFAKFLNDRAERQESALRKAYGVNP